MNQLKSAHDTRDVFHGKNIFKVWETEEERWIQETQNSDYDFPALEHSKYQNVERDKDLNSCIDASSPIICQNLTWSVDGTSLVAVFNDFGVRQYLVPEELESTLIPFKRFFRSQSIMESCVHPQYSLFNGNEGVNVMLASSRDLPIQLFSLSPHATDHASLFNYSVMNAENERYETIFALSFCQDSVFLAGTERNKFLAYDINRKNPIWCGVGNQFGKKSSGKVMHRSIVSCFDETSDPQNYPSMRYGGSYRCDIFGVDTRTKGPLLLADKEALGIRDGSCGIVQILSSLNKHYLYVVKRNSNTIDILDVRNGFSRVNEFILPFSIKKQKFKATLDPVNGLMIGTASGHILQWSSGMVEFGGLSSRTNEEFLTESKPSSTFATSYNTSKINILTSNPSDPRFVAASYSPDKHDDLDCEANSGLSIFDL